MSPLPDEAAYAAAMADHGAQAVHVDLTVLQLTMLLSTLQLALRHPAYPPHMRASVERFLDGATQTLTRLSPVLGQLIAAGNVPALDEEAAP
jgi:hypothetical protein